MNHSAITSINQHATYDFWLFDWLGLHHSRVLNTITPITLKFIKIYKLKSKTMTVYNIIKHGSTLGTSFSIIVNLWNLKFSHNEIFSFKNIWITSAAILLK